MNINMFDYKKNIIGNTENIVHYSDFEYIDFVQNEITIKRSSDLLYLESLEFEHTDNFMSIYSDANLIVKSNENIMVNIPFKILFEFNKLIECDNKIYLKLSSEYFLDDLLIIGMGHSTIKIIIQTNTNNLLQTRLLVKYTYTNDDVKESICASSNFGIIQSINLGEISNTNDNIVQYNLCPNKKYKGIFIKSHNIENINKIKLSCGNINDNVILNFDKYLLDNKCTRVSNNLIYIPFNSNFKYNVRSNFDFYNSLWTCNETNYVLEICFSEKLPLDTSDTLIYDLCVECTNTYSGIFDIMKITERFCKLTHYLMNNQNCTTDVFSI